MCCNNDVAQKSISIHHQNQQWIIAVVTYCRNQSEDFATIYRVKFELRVLQEWILSRVEV